LFISPHHPELLPTRIKLRYSLITRPRCLFIVWDEFFGIRCIARSADVKRLHRNQWNEAERHHELTFCDGLEMPIIAVRQNELGSDELRINSVGLWQICLHHMAKESKDGTFDPERDLRRYFDRSRYSHNQALNWFLYVFHHLKGQTPLSMLSDESLVMCTVAQEREMRGWYWNID